MAETPGRLKARELVQRLIDVREITPTSLARTSNIDTGTMFDFLLGKRWPQRATLAKIEKALGIRVGTVAGVAAHNPEAVEKLNRLIVSLERMTASDAAHLTASAREQLNPSLAEYTDRELLQELEGRMLLLATELHARGEQRIVTVVDEDGSPRFTSSTLGAV